MYFVPLVSLRDGSRSVKSRYLLSTDLRMFNISGLSTASLAVGICGNKIGLLVFTELVCEKIRLVLSSLSH